MKRKKALALAAPSYAANQNLLTLRKQRKCRLREGSEPFRLQRQLRFRRTCRTEHGRQP